MTKIQKILFSCIVLLFAATFFSVKPNFAYAEKEKAEFSATATQKEYDEEGILLQASFTQEGGTFTWYRNGVEVGKGSCYTVRTPAQSGSYSVQWQKGTDVFSSDAQTITVSPKPLSVTWHTQNSSSYPLYRSVGSYTYNGKTQGVYPFLDGVLEQDKGNVFVSATNNTKVHAGQYFAYVGELSGTAKDNYVLAKPQETFYYVIEQKAATVTVGNATLTYGNAFNINLPTVTAAGLAEGETIAVLDGYPTCTYNRFDDVGTYEIGYYYSSADYRVTVEKGNLTILPYEKEITLQNAQGVYGYDVNLPVPTDKGLNNEELGISLRLDNSAKPTIHYGTYTIIPSYTNKNYLLTFTQAVFTVSPMPITVRVKDATEYYGTDVSALYSVSLQANLPYDDTIADLALHLFPQRPVKNIGTYKITGISSAKDYAVTVLSGTLTVKPLPITVEIANGYSFYGKAFSTFTYSVKSDLPYAEKKEDLDIVILKEEGKSAGEYTLSGRCDNPNYDVTFKNGYYNVLPLPVKVDFSVCDDVIVQTGEEYPLVLPEPEGVLGNDEVGMHYTIDRLSINGLIEERDTVIDREGTYRVKISLANQNYYFLNTEHLFTVKSTSVTVEESGIVASLEGGYSSVTMQIFSSVKYDVDFYKTLAGILDMQEVCAEYSVVTEGADDDRITYSFIVDDENVFYSVATYKNGALVWLSCTQEGNLVSVTVPLGIEDSYTKFLLYRDIDYTGFLVADIVMGFVAVFLILFFFKLRKDRKNPSGAFAFLPLLSLTLPKGTLSLLVVLFGLEAVTIFIFGIAVLIEISIKNKKRR